MPEDMDAGPAAAAASSRSEPLTVTLASGSLLREDAKRLLRRLRTAALDGAPASSVWCCHNDGIGSHARHAWTQVRFELGPVDGPEARYLEERLGRGHFFLRYDLMAHTVSAAQPATIVLQEHWSETDPALMHGQYTECLDYVPDAGQWTRASIKRLIIASWDQLRVYRDADTGGAADGRFEDAGADQPCPALGSSAGLNNCVTFARHCFHMLGGRAGVAVAGGARVGFACAEPSDARDEARGESRAHRVWS